MARAGVEVRLERRTRLVVLQEPRLREAVSSLVPSVMWDVRFSLNMQPVRFSVNLQPVCLAARAVSLAASSGLGLVIFSLPRHLCFFSKEEKKLLRRISSQTFTLLKVCESLIYAV